MKFGTNHLLKILLSVNFIKMGAVKGTVPKVVPYFLHFSQNSDKTLPRRHKNVFSDGTRSVYISTGKATVH